MTSDGFGAGATVAPAPADLTLKRDFSFMSAFGLAFAFISPIIGVYTVFALSMGVAGPGFWWAILIALCGQLLVAVVMAETASRWPMIGGVYQWSRHLLGATYGWFAGWVYICTLVVATAVPAYVGATFLAPLVGVSQPTSVQLILFSLVILGAATATNALNRAGLKIVTYISICAEVLASIVTGTILLMFFRHNSIAVIFHGLDGHGLTLTSLVAATAIVGWAFVGFESAGSVAEETVDARRVAPKAIVLSLLFVGIVVLYSSLALILAIPASSLAGSADPITDTLSNELGAGVIKPLFAVVVVGFTAGTTAGQASVSRVIYALARDGVLPAHHALIRLSRRQRLPWVAILVVTAGAIPLILLSGTSLSVTIFSLATGGFYAAFAFPVVAALVARVRGSWTPGPVNAGRWGTAINVTAVLWLVFEIVNIAWPRLSDAPWYHNWGVVIMLGVIGIAGALAYRTVRHEVHAVAPPDSAAIESSIGGSIDQRSRDTEGEGVHL